MTAFSIVESFRSSLAEDVDRPEPIAAIFALSDLIGQSKAATTSELMESVKQASEELKASLENPVPATAGLELFMRFVTTKNWAGGVRVYADRRTFRRTRGASSTRRWSLRTTRCRTAASALRTCCCRLSRTNRYVPHSYPGDFDARTLARRDAGDPRRRQNAWQARAGLCDREPPYGPGPAHIRAPSC